MAGFRSHVHLGANHHGLRINGMLLLGISDLCGHFRMRSNSLSAEANIPEVEIFPEENGAYFKNGDVATGKSIGTGVHSGQLWRMQRGTRGAFKGTSASLKKAVLVPTSLKPGGADHVSLLKSLPCQHFGTAPTRTYCSGKSPKALGTAELGKMQDHLPGCSPCFSSIFC